MELGWDRIPIWKDETDVLHQMPTEVCLEGVQVHAILSIFPYRYMQPEFEFRPLLPLDYDQVVALWRRCDGVEVAEGDDRESFTRYLDRNPGLSYAATFAGIIVGAILCGHDGRRGLVYHVAVAPEHRGKGVGREILKRGMDGLRDCGIVRVIILVSKENSLGMEFWRFQGFEHISGAVPLGMDLR
jgi:ribosomal protein S18 acetylase RimI-like enzyme